MGQSEREGLAAVIINGDWGYIDRAGKVIIKPQRIDRAESFCNGLAAIMVDYKYGYIDKTGKIVWPPTR